MRLQQLLSDAEQRRAEAERRAAAERDERQRQADAEKDRRLAAFRAWLGELAEDLPIVGTPYWEGSGTSVVLEVRPVTWRIDRSLTVILDGHPSPVFGNGTAPGVRVDSPDDPRLVDWLAEAQRAHDAEVASRVASLRKNLSRVRVVGCDDDYARLAQTRQALLALAPERSAEWEALYAESVAGLEVLTAERQALYAESVAELEVLTAERQAQADKRAAAVERFRLARRAWAAEYEAVEAHNQAVRAALVAALGDVAVTVRELEYAVVADDDDGERRVETRTAWVEAINHDTSVARVIENGRGRYWTFRHVVRVSEPVEVRPGDLYGDDLFLCNWKLDVRYDEGHEAMVREAAGRLRQLPDEPSWDDISGGMSWGSDVYSVMGETP